MNKAVHALVYVILVVAAVALYFELQLNDKKDYLKERNRQLEDYLVTISRTIEKADAPKSTGSVEAMKDGSPVEAKLVETPEMENVLEGYPSHLEKANLETFKWDSNERIQLRKLYAEGPDGERIPDVANPGDFVKKGPGTAAELLDQLVERAQAQQEKLNTTRAELQAARMKIESGVNDYNKLKPDARQNMVTIEEKNKQIADLEAEKNEIADKLSKKDAEIEDLKGEVESVKGERDSAKDETENVKEDLRTLQAKYDKLMKFVQEAQANAIASSSASASTGPSVVKSLSVGEKGKIVNVNAKLQFVIVKFSPEAMAEMLGADRQGALPNLEMTVRRKGFAGPAGDLVGHISLRQVVPGKDYVIADILGDWQQVEPAVDDIVFSN